MNSSSVYFTSSPRFSLEQTNSRKLSSSNNRFILEPVKTPMPWPAKTCSQISMICCWFFLKNFNQKLFFYFLAICLEGRENYRLVRYSEVSDSSLLFATFEKKGLPSYYQRGTHLIDSFPSFADWRGPPCEYSSHFTV